MHGWRELLIFHPLSTYAACFDAKLNKIFFPTNILSGCRVFPLSRIQEHELLEISPMSAENTSGISPRGIFQELNPRKEHPAAAAQPISDVTTDPGTRSFLSGDPLSIPDTFLGELLANVPLNATGIDLGLTNGTASTGDVMAEGVVAVDRRGKKLLPLDDACSHNRCEWDWEPEFGPLDNLTSQSRTARIAKLPPID